MPVLLIIYISVTEVREQVDVIAARIFTSSSSGAIQRNKYAGVVVKMTVWHSCQVDTSMEECANACSAF